MNVQIQWFGVAWVSSTLVVLVGALALLVVGLGRVRRNNPGAGLLVASAAALEAVSFLGDLLVHGPMGWWLRTIAAGGDELYFGVLDAWTLGRPLLHALACGLLAWALVRVTGRR